MNKTVTLNMTGTFTYFFCVVIGFYSTSAQLWEKETLRNITACDFNSGTSLSCSADEIIALHSLQYAYDVRCETTCCDTYTSTDCFVNATSAEIQDLRRICSGKSTCTLPSPPSTLNFCSLGTKTTSYMFLHYYCIPKTRVSSVCSSGQTLTSDAEPLYLTNTNYPSVTTGSDSCSCSLEVHSCTSGINLYIFDADLYLETATCEQNIAFLGGRDQTLHTIGCENYYNHPVESHQVNGHYMKINFINNSTSNQEGYFFIALDASESGASFSLSCTVKQESWCTGCGNVPVISNGQIHLVDINNSSYGAGATVTCDSGYERNVPTISCLANNSWSDTSCTEKAACTADQWRCSNDACVPSTARCDNLPDCSDMSDEDNCNAATCPEGLEVCPHGNGSNVCVDKAVGCSCDNVPTITNGVINSEDSTIGSSADVVCDDGYETSKPKVICQTYGLWETATCNAKNVSTPVGKPTDENPSKELTLIISLVVVAVSLIQLVVMCFLQYYKREDNQVIQRIGMTILGSIPIIGLIAIYFTSKKFCEKVHEGKVSHDDKMTQVHKNTESSQMPRSNRTEEVKDQGGELSP